MGSFLDIIFTIIIIISVIDGYKKGFLKSLLEIVFTVVSIILSIIVTGFLWAEFADAVAPSAVPRQEFFTAFFAIAAVFIILEIISRIFIETAGFLNKVPVVGEFNRIFGVIFGFAEAVIIIIIISVLYTLYAMYTGYTGDGGLIATDTSIILNLLLGVY
jgi:uncharacterized membrane protein required for colicin V production